MMESSPGLTKAVYLNLKNLKIIMKKNKKMLQKEWLIF